MLASDWVPAADGAARLYRQLSSRGVDGYFVGEEKVVGERAIVPLVRGERALQVFMERHQGLWTISAVRENPAWASAFLSGELNAQAELTDLPSANDQALDLAAHYAQQLVEQEGQVDGAPFNLRLMVKTATSLDPHPRSSVTFGDRVAVAFALTYAKRGEQALWLVFAAHPWKLLKAVEFIDVVDLLPTPSPHG